MSILHRLLALGSFFAAGLAVLAGGLVTLNGRTVFDGLYGVCLWVVGAIMFAAAGVWLIVAKQYDN